MNLYFLLGTVSLFFQVAVLGLLLFSFNLKQRSSFRAHGLTMTAALSVHLLIILAIMAPSLLFGLAPKIAANPASPASLLAPLHAATGAAAAILALWIVGSWRLRQTTQFCAPKKNIMKYTLILWVITLILGIALYFVLYWK